MLRMTLRQAKCDKQCKKKASKLFETCYTLHSIIVLFVSLKREKNNIRSKMCFSLAQIKKEIV